MGLRSSRQFEWSITASAVLCCSVGHAQCLRYTVDMVPGPNCQFVGSASFAFGISATGELGGGYTPCGEGSSGAGVWLGSGGWLTVPPAPAGLFSSVNDINASRQLAATYSVSSSFLQRAAFIDFPSGRVTTLLPDGYDRSEAHSINQYGVISGYLAGQTALRAFHWQDGQMILLDLPKGPSGVAYDVSNKGSSCGWMGISPFLGAHAFIWNAGRTTDLGTVLPGSIGARANGINDLDHVCGMSHFDDPIYTYVRRGFIWRDGAAQDLGMLPGWINCHPKAINNSDTVVGYCSNEHEVSEGFIWHNGVIRRLNDLVYPPVPNLNIRFAHAINEAGQIAAEAGLGTNTVALRLNPIPPLVADITCDWRVNGADLLEVIRNWGPCPPPPPLPLEPSCPADLNGDNRVGVPDLLRIISHWSP